MKKPKLVKRYANRKLYDTQRSRYVTLEDIAEMIRTGEDVRVVDNQSKEDLTAVTLAQIIFESEKKLGRMPLSLLRGLIQSGEDALSDLVNRAVREPVQNIRAEVERTVERVVRGGEEVREEARTAVRDLVQSSGQVLEEWQKRVDEGVSKAVAAVSPRTGQAVDVDSLLQRLDALDRKVRKLERDRSAGRR
jgi:polyhydroxyalkanoate synthesis repressor PhaR